MYFSEDDSRKRMYQTDGFADDLSSKRAALGYSQGGIPEDDESNMLFKMLCPQPITGLIIGKGGAVIKELNQTTGAKIKLSNNNEFFPTTQDRVLVLTGDKDGLSKAVKELVTRVAESMDRSQRKQAGGDPMAPLPESTNFTMRVLIPRIASGLLIGKQGAVIKQMSQVSSCKIQLAEEADPFDTKERIITINSAAVHSLVLGAQTVMSQLLLQKPNVRSYPNPMCSYGMQGGGGMPMGGMGGPMGGMGGPMDAPRGPPKMSGQRPPIADAGYGQPQQYGGQAPPTPYGQPMPAGQTIPGMSMRMGMPAMTGMMPPQYGAGGPIPPRGQPQGYTQQRGPAPGYGGPPQGAYGGYAA